MRLPGTEFLLGEQMEARLISQKLLPVKQRHGLEMQCFIFLRVALKTGTSEEIHKDRGDLTLLC